MKFLIDKNDANCVYNYHFHDLTDLYEYLKSNPKINEKIFENPASMVPEDYFSGVSLEKSIEYLKKGYEIDFNKFNFEITNLAKFSHQDDKSRVLERTQHGGIYLAPLVAAGVPDCMVRYKRDNEAKRITIYFQLAYSNKSNQNQVLNRGIATLNLIQLLEEKGYIVDLKVFQLSYLENEFININIDIKNTDERLNISKCYYPLVAREFLRRLIFRVVESTPVKQPWGVGGYGQLASTEQIQQFYNLKETDILVTDPISLGIEGEDIKKDISSFLKSLELTDQFNIVQEKQKVLLKKKNTVH